MTLSHSSLPVISTWYYTVIDARPVRARIALRGHVGVIDWSSLEPYIEPPSRVRPIRSCPKCHRECTKHAAGVLAKLPLDKSLTHRIY